MSRYLPPDDTYIGATDAARRLGISRNAFRRRAKKLKLESRSDDHKNKWYKIVLIDSLGQTWSDEARKAEAEALERREKRVARKEKKLDARAQLAAPQVAANVDLYDGSSDSRVVSLDDTRKEIPPTFPARQSTSGPSPSVKPPRDERETASRVSTGRVPNDRGGSSRPESNDGRTQAPERVPSAAGEGMRRPEVRLDPHPVLNPVDLSAMAQRLPIHALSGTDEARNAKFAKIMEEMERWPRNDDGSIETLEDRENKQRREREPEQERQWATEGQRRAAGEPAGPRLAKTHPLESSTSDQVVEEPPPSRRTG